MVSLAEKNLKIAKLQAKVALAQVQVAEATLILKKAEEELGDDNPNDELVEESPHEVEYKTEKKSRKMPSVYSEEEDHEEKSMMWHLTLKHEDGRKSDRGRKPEVVGIFLNEEDAKKTKDTLCVFLDQLSDVYASRHIPFSYLCELKLCSKTKTDIEMNIIDELHFIAHKIKGLKSSLCE